MGHGRPAKRRKLTPPKDDDTISETINSADLFHRAADWDLEQEYEQRKRHKKIKENTKLPIKTQEGQIRQVQELTHSEDELDSFLGSGSEDENENDTTPPTEDIDVVPPVPLKQQLNTAKEEIARLDLLLKEDPEEHLGSFKKLAQIAGPEAHSSVQQLVLLAQAAIYRDSIPGYRIRAYKDEDLGAKVSKDIRQTRQYEHALVTCYHNYVKLLTALCKDHSKEHQALRTTALNCICTLLLAVPHFNFRTELLNALVLELGQKNSTPEFRKSLETLESFFQADEDGAPSLEAVNVLSKMMKAKDYNVQEEVLMTFFQLRLLGELSTKSSTTTTEKPTDISKLHGRKVKKDKWQHRSKKERKIARERKVVEKDMREASAAVDYEAREKMQSETLKIVFVTYFRILKAKIPHLMGAVLEGLAKYAHLINQDFFGDILEALKDIINQAEDAATGEEDTIEENPRDRMRESLLSTQTAFTLLSQQDAAKSASALHLDLSFFTSHIYRSLYGLALDADIELGPKSMRLPDPHQGPTSKRDHKVNVSTPVLLLTRALTSILLTPSQPTTAGTVASFYKRLLAATLHLPEKSTLAILSIMNKVVDKHGIKLEPLWYSDERKGDGVFRGEAETVEGTNVFAVGSGVWEKELLRHHYCPQVRSQVDVINRTIASLAK